MMQLRHSSMRVPECMVILLSDLLTMVMARLTSRGAKYVTCLHDSRVALLLPINPRQRLCACAFAPGPGFSARSTCYRVGMAIRLCDTDHDKGPPWMLPQLVHTCTRHV